MKFDHLRVRYFLHCLRFRNGYTHGQYLKKHNVFHSIGNHFFFQPYNLPADAKYIRFGNNVVVASDVRFICHDVIHIMLNKIPELSLDEKKHSTYWGIIDIKDNVFIGSNATILANVTIGSNVIIAAGSLVNKDVPDGKIVAGVPARVIGDTSDFVEKRKQYIVSEVALSKNEEERLRVLWRDR